jgi:ABC-type bacteriocin/lantibiotic exporter with double-glycine peptidase domain
MPGGRRGVRVIAQRTSWDCGVAAIAMLTGLSYAAVRAQIRRRPSVALRRDGLTIVQVRALARALGHPLRLVRGAPRLRARPAGLLRVVIAVGTPRAHGHWCVVSAGALLCPTGGEVWPIATYLTRHRAQPCELLVAA